jgi:hypothetical protein
MKLRNFFIAAVAGLFGLAACEGLEQDLGVAKISIDPLELKFPKEESSQSIKLTATRDWNVNVSALPEWIALSATEGKASVNEQIISVTVEKNDGNDREAAIVITAGMVRATLTVKQAGAKGEIQKGSGTLEDPYSVAGVIEYTQSLGADVQSTDKVYFKGIVSDVATTFEGSGNYGNASFYIVDSEGSTDKFYVFQTYYLGNRQWKSGDTEIKAGDEVIVYGPVVNYKGNTPETVGKGSSFIYSLNGQTEGGVVDEGEAKGDGTLDNPFNPAGAAAYAQSLGADVQSDKSVYIKGKISKVSTTFEASGNYGNANFYIVDATDGKGEFYIFQTYYLGNRKWAAGDTDVKEGDEVIVYGPVVNYRGNTPETVGKGASYIYSLNGQTGGSDQPGPVEEETTAEAAGDGSQANPFNVAAAIAKAKEVGETATSESYYIKGKVSTVKEAFGTQFGNGTFELIDEGYTAVFTAFRVLYFGNQKWVEGNASVAVGDEIVVVGKIVNYKGNTPETSQGSGYLYSLNGQTGIEQSDIFGVEKTEINVSASATSATVKVTGNVAWTATSTATIDKASGEGAGEIAVSFPANEDTENAKTYTVTLSTTADVGAKTITVTITQAKASGQASGEESKITISLTNTTTFAEDNGTDVLKGGFAATVEGFKVATYQYKSTSKPITPDQYSMRVYKSAVFYIEAPEGKTIKSLTFKGNNYDNGKYIKDLTGVEGTEGSAVANSDGTIGPWEGSASVVILQAAAAQTRLESVDVVFE